MGEDKLARHRGESESVCFLAAFGYNQAASRQKAGAIAQANRRGIAADAPMAVAKSFSGAII